MKKALIILSLLVSGAAMAQGFGQIMPNVDMNAPANPLRPQNNSYMVYDGQLRLQQPQMIQPAPQINVYQNGQAVRFGY